MLRVDDPSGAIDCSRAVSAVAGTEYCGDERVAEYMPAFVKGSPLSGRPLPAANYAEYLKFAVPKTAETSDYRMESLRHLSEL